MSEDLDIEVTVASQPPEVVSEADANTPPPTPPPVVVPDDVNCDVSAWVDGVCDVSCGSGSMTRTRTITVNPVGNGAACPALEETVSCDTGVECPGLETEKRDLAKLGYCPTGFELSAEECEQAAPKYGDWGGEEE